MMRKSRRGLTHAWVTRECVETGKIELEYVKSNDNITDILTKSLPKRPHEHPMVGLGVRKQGQYRCTLSLP